MRYFDQPPRYENHMSIAPLLACRHGRSRKGLGTPISWGTASAAAMPVYGRRRRMRVLNHMQHLAITGIPGHGRAVPHAIAAAASSHHPGIGKADRVDRIRARNGASPSSAQGQVAVRRTSRPMSPRQCAGRRVLPAHEQHVARAIRFIAIADADAVGIEAACWSMFEERVVMLREITAARRCRYRRRPPTIGSTRRGR